MKNPMAQVRDEHYAKRWRIYDAFGLSSSVIKKKETETAKDI